MNTVYAAHFPKIRKMIPRAWFSYGFYEKTGLLWAFGNGGHTMRSAINHHLPSIKRIPLANGEIDDDDIIHCREQAWFSLVGMADSICIRPTYYSRAKTKPGFPNAGAGI